MGRRLVKSVRIFDFAGAGIVHMAGASAALAAVLLIGPRIGKYDYYGNPQPIHGSNAAQVTLGTFILWFGWFGFNGGSQLSIVGIENANAVAKIFCKYKHSSCRRTFYPL